MSRDQDANVDFSAWNVVNASSSEVMESGAHSLNKMLIRCAYLGYSATGSGCVGLRCWAAVCTPGEQMQRSVNCVAVANEV